MSVWNSYSTRMASYGGTQREVTLNREKRFINTKLPNNLSYTEVLIYPEEYGYNIETKESREHRITQSVAIIDSDNLDEKVIFAMPSEDIELGSLVYWMDNYWLVTERDANTTIRTRAKLLQCNQLLKWVSSDDQIIEQWSCFEDGTKYLTGHYEDKDFFTTRGDARISIQLAKNKYSAALDRTYRFIIGDLDASVQMAYLLTKPLKGNLMYNGKGTYSFVLQEGMTTEYDNLELGIADYYKHFPKSPVKVPLDDVPYDAPPGDPTDTPETDTGTPASKKKMWL